jgi:hypothetical protein
MVGRRKWLVSSTGGSACFTAHGLVPVSRSGWLINGSQVTTLVVVYLVGIIAFSVAGFHCRSFHSHEDDFYDFVGYGYYDDYTDRLYKEFGYWRTVSPYTGECVGRC